MSTALWPLFGLRVATPRLELRYIDDDLAVQLAQLATRGIHDPAFMPFAFEWTDAPADRLARNTLQYYWRCRADLSPQSWDLGLAVVADGVVVGCTGLAATNFPTLRTFETGSWLGRTHQGQGLGRELRQAALHLGFAGLGATRATTSAFSDNAASLGVTRSLGYEANGEQRHLRRGVEATTLKFRLSVDDWQTRLRRDDIIIHGLESCLALLGLAPPSGSAPEPA